jgi:hypothetical protein
MLVRPKPELGKDHYLSVGIVLDRQLRTDRNGISADEWLECLGEDTDAEKRLDRLGTSQCLPDISGCQQHVHHAIQG